MRDVLKTIFAVTVAFVLIEQVLKLCEKIHAREVLCFQYKWSHLVKFVRCAQDKRLRMHDSDIMFTNEYTGATILFCPNGYIRVGTNGYVGHDVLIREQTPRQMLKIIKELIKGR